MVERVDQQQSETLAVQPGRLRQVVEIEDGGENVDQLHRTRAALARAGDPVQPLRIEIPINQSRTSYGMRAQMLRRRQ